MEITRFEEFTSDISQLYKYVLKLRSYEMQLFGLKASNLMCFYNIGKHTEGITAIELGELCHEDKAGISKSIADLKSSGMITVKCDNEERVYRSKFILTQSGSEVFKKVTAFVRKTVNECGEGLTDEERASFYRSLRLILTNMKKFHSSLEEIKNESDI